MKRYVFKTIFLVFVGLANFSLAGEMDLSADTTFIAKPRRRAAPAMVVTAKKAPVPAKAPIGPTPAPTQWLQAMEGSLSPFASQHPDVFTGEGWDRTFILWLGWALAGVFGAVLLAQSLRNRRRTTDLVRAGKRDTLRYL